jgi:hypothetical protein
MSTLRSRAIHLAHTRPDLRPVILPLLGSPRTAGDPKTIQWMTKAKDDLTEAGLRLVAAVGDLRSAAIEVTKALNLVRAANVDISDADTVALEMDLKRVSKALIEDFNSKAQVVEAFQVRAEESVEQYESEIAHEKTH